MKNKALLRSSLALALFGAGLAASSAMAATISLTPNPQTIQQTGSADVTIAFTGDGATNAFSGAVIYDTVRFNATAVPNGSDVLCAVNDAFNATDGRVAIVVTPGGGPLADRNLCVITFTTNAAALGNTALTWVNPVFGGSGGGDTANDGALNVIDVIPEPPTISFNPNGGMINLTQGGGAVGGSSATTTITATAAGGIGGGTGSYNCTVPAGFAVTNNANPAFANGSADLGVSCTMAAAGSSAAMSCAVTDADGARSVDFTLNCPAGASAVYNSVPAPGVGLAACDGGAGEVVNTTLTINNTGTPANPESAADDLAVACSVAGANFAIGTGPTTPLEAGSSTTVTVACTVPGTGTATGTLTCNGNDYPLSSSVRTAPVVVSPAIVPSTSFWSKMILFGLLAGLGMLVVSLRRNG